MTGEPSLHHVQVAAPAGCEAEARRFFGELLGLRELTKPTALRGRGGVWFALAGAELHVGVEEDFRPARKAHPGLAVGTRLELEALAARLQRGGAAVTWAEDADGAARLHTHDPWGNRLELRTTDPTSGGW